MAGAGIAGGGSVTGLTDASNVAITGGSITGITDLAVADGGTGASSAANARTNLGLGTIATQAANSVSISGGSVTGITDLAVADGGTGASTAAGARTNLGAHPSAVTVEAHTGDDTLTTAESGSVHTNRGAGGTVILTLPAASTVGTWFSFFVHAAQALDIVAAGTDTIQVAATTGAGGGKTTSNLTGAAITLACDAAGTWVALSQQRTWTTT